MSVQVLINFNETGKLVIDEGSQILSENRRRDEEGDRQCAHSPFEQISHDRPTKFELNPKRRPVWTTERIPARSDRWAWVAYKPGQICPTSPNRPPTPCAGPFSVRSTPTRHLANPNGHLFTRS